uniref:Minor capsid protein L2 n=1 Tax=Human papillomavirus TaxID=10566 RepID=A0A346TID2_9PAPI|nr:L2 protein [Human papillomavirus]
MLKARRNKRAAVEDLYKSCKLGGDCLPDVQNKVEGTTLADRLLQIFGSILYFGNLGIGTGKGTGGWGGYRPFGGTAGRTPEISVSKPAVPIDPLGGTDVIPLNVIDAEAPSIIPLIDGTPDVPPIDTGAPTIDVAELDVTTSVQPTDILPTTTQQPTIITGSEVSVIDYQPGPPLPKRLILDADFKPYQDIHLNVFPEPKNFDSNVNIFVDPNLTGDTVGFEEIELSTLSKTADFEIEEAGFKSSTPTQPLGRVAQQGRQLYNRFMQQVNTRNPEFISRPSRLVTFDFENPAFEDEVTLQFEQDVNQIEAAPDTDFQDIVKLSRPIFSETNIGVRVSRIGQKGSITTRSGLRIGQKVHYYFDVSPIPRQENIELQSLGAFGNDVTIINAPAESTFINETTTLEGPVPDNILEDIYEETFDSSHLVLTVADNETDSFQIPTYVSRFGIIPIISNFDDTLHIDFPYYENNEKVIPDKNVLPTNNAVETSLDFTLHPDLMRKRRKRKRKYNYF